MKTFLLDIPDRFRRFDEQLDVKALLCNKSWQVFNDSGVKEIYIFQEDGSLIISLNGKVSRATWQYIPANRSLIINSDNESYMLRPFFQDENLFTLQLDGTREYSFLLNEAQRASFPVKSLSDLKFYLEHKEERLLQIQVEKERQLALQQREEELRKKKRGERKERLQAFIKENLSKDECFLKLKRKEKKGMIYTGLFQLIGFIGFIGLVSAPNFHLPEWLFTIIFILVTLTLIIYSLRLSSHKDEYETNAIKLLTEEFNRKYPEEDD